MIEKFKNILLLKSHSAGIGDILRSSAAWKAIKNKSPDVNLHLLFITNHPGYPSEELIKKHHLLSSFHTINKEYFNSVRDFKKAIKLADEIISDVKPDFIIDFEPYGLETTIVSLIGRLKYKIPTLGINEVFPRGLLYTYHADSVKKFMKKHNMDILNYTDRDFVVLDRLGIERGDIQIEIKETEEATKFRENLRKILGLSENQEILIVNIGCGTEDAIPKRPDFSIYEFLISKAYENYGLIPVLIGAKFEKNINQDFIKKFSLKHKEIPIFDIAGETTITESVGAINAGRIVISSDSGPYHIAVALKKPNLALFNFENTPHYHFNPWTICRLVNPPDFNQLEKDLDYLYSLNMG
jgi:ADP-heptose:LPS heptosyltransferase